MKKIIILLGASLLITASLYAQENDYDMRSDLQFGVKAGANLSNVYDTKGEDFRADPRLGFVTGFFIGIPLGELLGFQPEVLFSQKGFNGTGKFLGLPYEFSRRTNFIDIPLLVQIKPSEFITFLAGPQYSYLIKQVDVFDNNFTVLVLEENFSDVNIRKNLFCFVAGVDINIKHIVIGGRIGIDLQSNSDDGSSETPRYKNVWGQATVGYRLY